MSISEELRQNRLVYNRAQGETLSGEAASKAPEPAAPKEERIEWPAWEKVPEPVFPERLEGMESTATAVEALDDNIPAMEYPVATGEETLPATDPVEEMLRRWEREERLLPQDMEGC